MGWSRQARLAAVLLSMTALLITAPTASSHGTRQASSVSGHITTVADGIQVALTNTGTDAFNYFWIRMVPSVHHTGATIDRGGGCGPGPDANTVKCGVSLAGFRPGETYTVTIMTDGPYPPNGGAELFTGPGTDGPLVPAGTADGPPAPPEPCKCLSLTATIPAASLKLEARPAATAGHEPDLRLHLRLVASLKCSAGNGAGCQATVSPSSREWYFETETHLRTDVNVECDAPCGSAGTGQKSLVDLLRGLDREDLAKLGRKTIVLRRTCNGKALPAVTLWVAFDRVGRVSIAKSRLG